ncbi:MAG TPA: hypothetical protein VHX44_15615 [Planctomycetota bacterium]|nr:hypothetical protein [Planctomycetota bacterium]
MKPMFLLILMTLTSWVAALENSLVMRSPGQGAGLYAVVSPNTGNITLYGLEGQQTTRYASGNFLADLANLEGLPGGTQAGITYSVLRLSHKEFTPTPSDLLFSPAFPEKPSAKEQAAGLKALRYRATEAENNFWAEIKPYDGVVRGAMGSQYLLLCIPIKHALLCYDCQDRNKGPILISYRNYGVDLMIPQTLASDPAPQAILNALPADIKEDTKKALEESLNALAEGGGAVKLEPSDPWIACGTGDRWVLVDPPNKHICTYEFQGKRWVLKSARNLEVDHLIPTSFRSSPDEQQGFAEYMKSRKKQLDAGGIIPDLAYFKALVDQKQVASGKTSDIQASIVGDDLMLDFVKMRKLYAYRLLGANNGLELLSMRDYTLDVGLALQDVEFRAEADAINAWNAAKKFITNHDDANAWLCVKYALSLDPSIYKVIEKDAGAKGLKKLPDWQATLDDAIKRSQEKEKQLEERRKAAEEARKAKKDKTK